MEWGFSQTFRIWINDRPPVVFYNPVALLMDLVIALAAGLLWRRFRHPRT